MTAITISREFGSEGDFIARKVAQSLGYHIVDRAFLGEILSQYGLVEFDKEYASLPGFWEKCNAQREKRRDTIVNMLNQVMRAVGQHGHVVILGRSGFVVLEGFADVLHVRVQAPFAMRVGRVMAQQQIGLEQAEAAVRENDKVRMAFIEEFYRVPWRAIEAFDLVINTGKITPELAATWIVEAARAFLANPDPRKPTIASIEVDPILSKTVADALMCKEEHAFNSSPP